MNKNLTNNLMLKIMEMVKTMSSKDYPVIMNVIADTKNKGFVTIRDDFYVTLLGISKDRILDIIDNMVDNDILIKRKNNNRYEYKLNF